MAGLPTGRDRGRETSGGPMKLVVGLGNPGVQYARNRHNVGFMLLDRLAAREHAQFSRKRFNAKFCETILEGEHVLLFKPQTYMNLSGNAVGKFASFYHVSMDQILIVYDDLDLPLGRLKLRGGGGAGGHHGMESVIRIFGNDEIPRLRIGIGRPDSHADVAHVLGDFSSDETRVLDEVLDRGEQAVRVWLSGGITKAMNQFNRADDIQHEGEAGAQEGA